MNKKGLTLSVICNAEGANYGQGFSNISLLKKISREDGNTYTYISRQALRYSMMRQLNWLKTPTDVQGKVAQFAADTNIYDYPEIDLFGYMKTISKKSKRDQKGKGDDKTNNNGGSSTTRAAVVRLSNAISLEPYLGEADFGTNMSLTDTKRDKNEGKEIPIIPYTREIHKSYYSYTVTIDMDRVGIDENYDNGKSLSIDIKTKRIRDFLNTIFLLNRDIVGKDINLNPIFIIGGLYDVKNPYFDGVLRVSYNNLNIECIRNTFKNYNGLENTKIGYFGNIFNNDKDIYTLEPKPLYMKDVLNLLCDEVGKYYANYKA